MRRPQPAISLSARSSASTSAPVSRYSARRLGSPKSGWNEPSKPPMKPFVPATPTSTPAHSPIHAAPSSTSTSPSRSTPTNSLWRLTCQSWLPSTATTGRSVSRRQETNSSASSGSPCVVRSPAMSTTSAWPFSPANDAATASPLCRSTWMSPAAATRTHGPSLMTPRGLPRPSSGETSGAMAEHSPQLDELLDTLKKCAAALRDAGVPFMVGGGVAAWARGGPESIHDLDLIVKPDDAETALATLEGTGLRTEHPPEGWLLKAWDGNVLIDLIYKPQGMAVDDDALARAEILNVKAMEVPVMPIADVMTSKLMALNERWLDYDQLLQMARACREQVDWEDVRRRTCESPFARAFFEIVDGLGITETERVG